MLDNERIFYFVSLVKKSVFLVSRAPFPGVSPAKFEEAYFSELETV